MNPVSGRRMLAFLQWLSSERSVDGLTTLSEEDMVRLAARFQNENPPGDRMPLDDWRSGVHMLLKTKFRRNGYNQARKFLRSQGSLGGMRARLARRAAALGARLKLRSYDGRTFDPLDRFRSVPLHAVVLYTTEDAGIQDYLLQNWGALDGLSGDVCDIYPSIDQLRGLEDAYDLIRDSSPTAGIGRVPITDLPGIFFWDNAGRSEYVPLRTGDSIVQTLRTVFSHIRSEPTIAAVARGRSAVGNPAQDELRVLILAANPATTDRRALDEEISAITRKVRMADDRDSLKLIPCWAVRPDDVMQYLNEHRPHIVQFSGQGNRDGSIVLAGDDRNGVPVSPEALRAVFSAFHDNVRVVLLNACYSKIQAEAISAEVEFVIGMDAPISDEAAMVFASSFYSALGFGRSIPEAFAQAKAAWGLHGYEGGEAPQLFAHVR